MDELMKVLDELFKSDEPTEDNYFLEEESTLAMKAVCLCNENLISSGGCNWKNIDALRNAGYFVFRGDGDSFGWLTGCVQKKGDMRILVYG